MRRLLAAMVCATSLVSAALGQSTPNFGSRTGGLGNAAGFATGGGLSNGSSASLNFSRNAGFGFGNTAGFSNGGNAVYYGADSFSGGSVSWGGSNVGGLNAAGPSAPPLGLGANSLGLGGWDGLGFSGMDVPSAALYAEALGLGAPVPVLGLDPTAMGLGAPALDGPALNVPGFSYGAPALNYGAAALNYGLPASSYGVASPAVAGATTASAAARRARTENFVNNTMQNRADATRAAVPIVTADALRIQERIARSVSRSNFRNVKVLMSGRTVVLQGSVDSRADGELVQRLISLEPSVDSVISQLNYPGKAPTGAPTQPR